MPQIDKLLLMIDMIMMPIIANGDFHVSGCNSPSMTPLLPSHPEAQQQVVGQRTARTAPLFIETFNSQSTVTSQHSQLTAKSQRKRTDWSRNRHIAFACFGVYHV